MGKNDVSKQTVLVLLVLTIAISVIGTWTVLNGAVNGPIYLQPDGANQELASVQLEVSDAPLPAKESSEESNIRLEIS